MLLGGTVAGELKAMIIRTGAANLKHIDPAVIHPIDW